MLKTASDIYKLEKENVSGEQNGAKTLDYQAIQDKLLQLHPEMTPFEVRQMQDAYPSDQKYANPYEVKNQF